MGWRAVGDLGDIICFTYKEKCMSATRRPVTLFTGQWADLSFETLCKKAKSFGYDGVELACWGDHFEVRKVLDGKAGATYMKKKWLTLQKQGLKCFAISSHLVGQAVCDNIDARHKQILPDVCVGGWRAGGRAAAGGGGNEADGDRGRKFFDAAQADQGSAEGVRAWREAALVVNGFTGSSIWHLVYSFPPVLPRQIEDGYKDFARAVQSDSGCV